ncbi:hypothetical protein FB45DRAFT_908714, partial [Roridomyces roridus]
MSNQATRHEECCMGRQNTEVAPHAKYPPGCYKRVSVASVFRIRLPPNHSPSPQLSTSTSPTMHFAALSLSTLVPLLLSAVVGATPAPAAAPVVHVVWSPKILVPTEGTVWESNSKQTIMWDATNAPENITNESFLFLRHANSTAPFVLAKDFDLRAGHLDITVPYVISDDQYQFVLFGDSGNFSPVMTIHSDVFGDDDGAAMPASLAGLF